MKSFIVGGSAELIIDKVTVSDVVLASDSDVSDILLMVSENNKVTDSNFDNIRSSSKFRLASIYFKEAT